MLLQASCFQTRVPPSPPTTNSTVYEIMLKYNEVGDWKQAFVDVIPKRKGVEDIEGAGASGQEEAKSQHSEGEEEEGEEGDTEQGRVEEREGGEAVIEEQ